MKILLSMLFAAVCMLPSLAEAEVRAFAGKCPICIEQSLKSEVKVVEKNECPVHPNCSPGDIWATEEGWDNTGKYSEPVPCRTACDPKFYYTCSQGHTFETLNDKRAK